MDSKPITQETIVALAARLEALIQQLEGKVSEPVTVNTVNLSTALINTEKIAAFAEYWKKTLHNLLEFKKVAADTKSPEIELITEIVIEGVCFQQDILIAAESFKKPQGKDYQDLVKKFSQILTRFDEIKKDKKDFALFCEAAKTAVESLFWIFNDNSCDNIVQTYFEAIDFPGNKIFAKKVPEQSAWVKSLKPIFKDTIELVKANYKSGINWALKGEDDINKIILSCGNTFRKNFKQQESLQKTQERESKQEESRKNIKELLISGELRKSLKPVVKNVVEKSKEEVAKANELFKNEHLKTEKQVKTETKTEIVNTEVPPKQEEKAVAPKSTTVVKKSKEAKRGRRETILKRGRNEKYEAIRGSFYFENLEDEIKELDEERLETKTILTLNNCYNCTFSVKKKINAIKLSNCENVNIICDSLISIFEIINSVGLKIQVDGIIRSFTIDGSSEIMVVLYPKCKDAQFITSKSYDIRLRLRKEEDHLDYNEIIIPEQFIFQINDKKKLDYRVSDLYNY